MRPTFIPAVLLLGAVACGDPFGPDAITGAWRLEDVSGDPLPVRFPPDPPPLGYDLLGGALEFEADRTVTITLSVRVIEYTSDGSRIVGIRTDRRVDTEVGTYEVLWHGGNQMWLGMKFPADGRFGGERTVTISRSQYRSGPGFGETSSCELTLQRPGDPAYVFRSSC